MSNEAILPPQVDAPTPSVEKRVDKSAASRARRRELRATRQLSPVQVKSLRETLEGPFEIRSNGIRVIAALSFFFAAYFAKTFLIGVLFAMILKMALARPVRLLARHRIPKPLGAAVVLGALVSGLVALVYTLATPAGDWLEQLPRDLRVVRSRLSPMAEPVAKISSLSNEVSEIVDEVRSEGNLKPLQVELADETTFLERLTSNAWAIVGNIGILVVLLFFMLSNDESFLRKLVRLLPTLSDKKAAVTAGRAIESEISRYIITVSLINVGLAATLWIAFSAIGLPNPLLWATMAGVLNFIPYVGAMVGVAIVAAVSILTFPAWQDAITAPGVYLLATALEGGLVTPTILGRHMSLSPVAIFVWLLLWSFLWGIPGALIAVPLLVAVRIVCENIPSLRPIGVLLGRAESHR